MDDIGAAVRINVDGRQIYPIVVRMQLQQLGAPIAATDQ
jgi:hypothetical protein